MLFGFAKESYILLFVKKACTIIYNCPEGNYMESPRRWIFAAACRAMQQSLNFRQLWDTLAGAHGQRVWDNAFNGTSAGVDDHRFRLRNEFIHDIRAQRVCSLLACCPSMVPCSLH
jgi:hypothetical protein